MRFCVDCDERRSRTLSRPTAVRRADRFLRWTSFTHFLIHALTFAGVLPHFVGILLGLAHGSWHLAVASSIVLAIAFTVAARGKNRSWLWGLLGVLGFLGAAIVLPLRERCDRCGRKVPPDEARCAVCHGPSGFR